MSDANVIWTCFRYFLYCLRPSSTNARGFKSINIGYNCIWDTVAGGACISISRVLASMVFMLSSTLEYACNCFET